jgi:glucose/arabinose dehydrogenase
MDYPWAFEFINNDEILLTQIASKLVRINLRTQESTAITGLPVIGGGYTQIGLLDIEIHPDFANNQRIYFSYSKPNPASSSYHLTEVATGILVDNEITELKTLVNSEDYGWAPSNFGGALEFDDRGYLYISMGDRGQDNLARRPERLEGKLLRLNDDGSTPADNPFVDKEGYDPRIYVMGIRNAQGLHFDSQSGLLFESEHGPLGGDEVNIIKPGADYGWPTISYGNNYATTKPIGEGTHKEGLQQPVFYFLPSIAASPLTVYRGDMFPEWEGDILVGALRGKHIAKLDFDQNLVRSSQSILGEIDGRIRDIKVAADGSIYILSQTSGLHRLYRNSEPAPGPAAIVSSDNSPVTPAPSKEPPVHPGKEYYLLVCSGCHNSGTSGAPVLGDYEQWQPIMEQPMAVTRERVMNGYNAMPERGLCYTCDEFTLMQMVDYMFTEARKNME